MTKGHWSIISFTRILLNVADMTHWQATVSSFILLPLCIVWSKPHTLSPSLNAAEKMADLHSTVSRIFLFTFLISWSELFPSPKKCCWKTRRMDTHQYKNVPIYPLPSPSSNVAEKYGQSVYHPNYFYLGEIDKRVLKWLPIFLFLNLLTWEERKFLHFMRSSDLKHIRGEFGNEARN